ncbi:recombinase family protein [Actinomadura syzygii]|nr:recombinase family protein [Actinomadura syzygii]
MTSSAVQNTAPDSANRIPAHHPLNLVAYARISDVSAKRRTPDVALGVEAQHLICAAMARDTGAVVIKRYTDNDRSASRDEPRPGFEAMLADLHRGRTADDERIDGVVTVDVDRIYKTPVQWERFITAFRAFPARGFLAWQGPRDLYGPDADESGLQDVSVALGENRRRSDRTKRWHASQARRGVAHTGGRSFGYRPVAGVPGAIEVVPAEAAVIREAVAACVAGQSFSAITRIFARSGLPTRNGGPWRTQTVKQIISSPRLAGLRVLDDEIVTDEAGDPLPGRWEPIITPAEWQAVCRRYAPRRRAPGGRSAAGEGRTPRKYLLSGFLQCGNEADGRLCRCVLAGCATKVGRSNYRYACRPASDGGCGGSSVRGEWMDQEVADLVLGVLAGAPPDSLKQGEWVRAREFEAVNARLDDLEARLDRGDVVGALYEQRRANLKEIVQDLAKEKEAREAVEACLSDDAAERLRQWRLSPGEGGYDLQQRRALVARVLSSVLVFPVGRGRSRQPGQGYLPVLDRGLVMPDPP